MSDRLHILLAIQRGKPSNLDTKQNLKRIDLVSDSITVCYYRRAVGYLMRTVNREHIYFLDTWCSRTDKLTVLGTAQVSWCMSEDHFSKEAVLYGSKPSVLSKLLCQLAHSHSLRQHTAHPST